MKRSRRLRPLDLRRLRLPALAVLAVVGFVVPGGSGAAGWSHGTGGLGPLPGHIPGDVAAAVPSAGVASTLAAVGGPRPDARTPGSRVQGGPGPSPAGAPALRPGVGVVGARSAGASVAGPAPSRSALDALRRAGRLSAPTTAPPASPFRSR